ncbi:MAG TPA: hypothetical protein VIO81_08935 [Methyloversatilis sp.]
MKGRKRTSRRVLRNFLHLAATLFAINANAAPATGDEDSARTPTEQTNDSARADDMRTTSGQAAYRHTFALAAPALDVTGQGVRARVRVIDERGRDQALLALHGASMVGPFAHGAYTVLVKAGGATEVHRIRIGPDTMPYLHFTDALNA